MCGPGETLKHMDRPGDREARFMGRITAGMTHEIRNVLAIVRESAGLMEDLLSMEASASFPHRDRFHRALRAIQEQVDRGVDLATRLNRFAHSMDQQLCEVNLGELLEQVGALLRRQARNKKVELRLDPGSPQILVVSDPFRLGMLLCSCVEHCMDAMSPGQALELKVLGSERSPMVEIKPWAQEPEGDASWEPGPPPGLCSLSDVLQALGICMRHSGKLEGQGLRLCLGISKEEKSPLESSSKGFPCGTLG
ncbi:MAG: hypothetical protein WHX93_07525 [bacterium]